MDKKPKKGKKKQDVNALLYKLIFIQYIYLLL